MVKEKGFRHFERSEKSLLFDNATERGCTKIKKKGNKYRSSSKAVERSETACIETPFGTDNPVPVLR